MPVELTGVAYTIAEAAAMLGLGRRLILRHIAAKHLAATKQDGKTAGYLIAADDLAAWHEKYKAGEFPKAGKPARKESNG